VGQDFEKAGALRDLLETILKNPDIRRLRLSSLEPWDLDEGFFSLWQDQRVCRHLHLPLQSGSVDTLWRMARKITPDSFVRLVETARAAIPELAVTTDVIAGFPGESDQEFSESLEFVRRMNFAVGTFSHFQLVPGRQPRVIQTRCRAAHARSATACCARHWPSRPSATGASSWDGWRGCYGRGPAASDRRVGSWKD